MKLEVEVSLEVDISDLDWACALSVGARDELVNNAALAKMKSLTKESIGLSLEYYLL